jgi:hypothetical protein
MVTIRFASIVFPEPGGPTSSRLWSEHLQALAVQPGGEPLRLPHAGSP